MSNTSPLDGFFFYLFLPSIAILSIYIYRLYNQKHDTPNKFTQFSSGLLIGNVLYSIIGATIILFLYVYTLDLSPIIEIKWEFLTLCSLIYISLLIGIGLGGHTAGVTFEKQLREILPESKYTNISKTIHFYHATLGHKLPYTGILLSTYSLTMLDLFKGQIVPMHPLHTYLSILTGIILGSLLSFLTIVTYCQNLIKRTTAILLVSILITTLNESISLYFHPVSILFTSLYSTMFLLLTVETYLPRWIVKILIKASRSLLKWDGIILTPDHQRIHQLKSNHKQSKIN